MTEQMNEIKSNELEQPLTIDQVCKLLGVCPRTVRRHIQAGNLKAKKIGKRYFIRREDYNNFLK